MLYSKHISDVVTYPLLGRSLDMVIGREATHRLVETIHFSCEWFSKLAEMSHLF